MKACEKQRHEGTQPLKTLELVRHMRHVGDEGTRGK